jgi:molybdopterin molybdotransferase
MITIEKAKELVQKQEVRIVSQKVLIKDALDYVLSENVFAVIDLPPFPQSAVDGYAVNYEDINGENTFIKVTGEVAAGNTQKITLQNGTSIRIFTGAPVPENATAVVMQEKTQNADGGVIIKEFPLKKEQNIRPVGDEIKSGELLLPKGIKLNPASIAVLQSQGLQKVSVSRKPNIGILVTGTELIEPGQSLEYGQIYESNSAALVNALKKYSYPIQTVSKAEDDYNLLLKKLKLLFDANDVIIVSGGISVGDYDFTGKALEELGVEEIFYKVNQKPGKPIFFGKKENTFVFGLPGNPAAALVCLYQYVIPLLAKIEGQVEYPFPIIQVQSEEEITVKDNRGHFLKAFLKNGKISLLGKQGSHMLQTFATSNALIYLPAGKNKVKKGEMVEVHLV